MNNSWLTNGGGVPQAPHPLPAPDGSVLRALKADIVLGAQLVSRHRSPRLAAVLVLALLVAAGGYHPAPNSARVPMAVVAVGVLAAVAASRLFAPGGALAANRAAAARWWVAPVGRLTGALLLVLPLGLAGTAFLVLPGAGLAHLIRVSIGLLVYVTALAAGTAAITPLVGSSPAAVIGLASAWFGVIAPSALGTLLGGWPFVARPLVALWNVLPLPWRLMRWIGNGTVADPGMLALWIVVGITVLAWSPGRFYRTDPRGGRHE